MTLETQTRRVAYLCFAVGLAVVAVWRWGG